MEELTTEQLVNIVDSAIESYSGNASHLIGALGALFFGKFYGWRVLRIVISNNSYLKYQKILSVEFKDILPKETKRSDKSIGYSIVKKLDNFWDVVSGRFSIDANQKRKLL